MARVDYKENIFNEHFFKKFQDLGLILRTFPLFPVFSDIVDIDRDTFIVEYDESVGLHALLHTSAYFGEKRPICYLNQNDWNMKKYHKFILNSFTEAYVEYLI